MVDGFGSFFYLRCELRGSSNCSRYEHAPGEEQADPRTQRFQSRTIFSPGDLFLRENGAAAQQKPMFRTGLRSAKSKIQVRAYVQNSLDRVRAREEPLAVPRSVRLEYAGALYHVMGRGDRREAIFSDDGDREMFPTTLAQMCARSGMRVHSPVSSAPS